MILINIDDAFWISALSSWRCRQWLVVICGPFSAGLLTCVSAHGPQVKRCWARHHPSPLLSVLGSVWKEALGRRRWMSPTSLQNSTQRSVWRGFSVCAVAAGMLCDWNGMVVWSCWWSMGGRVNPWPWAGAEWWLRVFPSSVTRENSWEIPVAELCFSLKLRPSQANLLRKEVLQHLLCWWTLFQLCNFPFSLMTAILTGNEGC